MTKWVRFTALGLVLLGVLPVVAATDEDVLGPALDKLMLGDPEGAVQEALKVTRKYPGHLKGWFLCGMVRFENLGDYAGSVECHDHVIALVQDGEVEFPELRHAYRGRGVSHLMLGNYERAEADLRRGIELERDGVHAHLLWFLAATRVGVAGEPVLRGFAETHESREWPQPLVSLYLGDAPPEECLAAAVAQSRSETLGNLCEAHFYLAEFLLLKGDEQLARKHFELCVETGMDRYAEYRVAQRELERLAGPDRPGPASDVGRQ